MHALELRRRGPRVLLRLAARPDGPIAGRDGAAAREALAAELARRGDREAWLDVPGSSRELVEVALAAGLRITGPAGLLLLARGLEPPRSLAISGYWLF